MDEKSSIARSIEEIRANIARYNAKARLIGVTKTVSAEKILFAVSAGLTEFGESKIQEALPKMESLKAVKPSITWHFIGHLQTNKVNKVTGGFELIHSTDSLRLAEKISMTAGRTGIKQNILMELKVSEEDTKFGIDYGTAVKDAAEIIKLPGVNLKGIMAMAPYSDDPEASRPYFKKARAVFEEIKKDICPELSELSMGMTHDYVAALQEGATMIRVGSGIFGERNYK